MSAAKGLCYALQKPLIMVGTLQMMAAAALNKAEGLLCPMIDARRMEIFTAIYDGELNEVVPPSNLIVEQNPFMAELNSHVITFFGNGYGKLKTILEHPNARFAEIESTAQAMTSLSFKAFKNNDFADLAYAEPFYGKEFYTPAAKNRTKNQ
jgi:tRNA threonylcarbamoyladenosine biosynthesis protein TsaB